MIAVFILLLVLARMSQWRKQVIKCQKFYLIYLSGEGLTSFYRSRRTNFCAEKKKVQWTFPGSLFIENTRKKLNVKFLRKSSRSSNLSPWRHVKTLYPFNRKVRLAALRLCWDWVGGVANCTMERFWGTLSFLLLDNDLWGCQGNWVKISPLKNSSKMQFDTETPTKLWLIATMRFALPHLIC